MKNRVIIIVTIIMFVSLLIASNLLIDKKNKELINSYNISSNNQKESVLNKEYGGNSMTSININDKNFEEEVLNEKGIVLVDFYADWCMPCKMLSPIIEEVSNERQDIKVVKINLDENPYLAQKYEVMSIPTIIVFEDGKIKNKSVGLVDKERILKLID